MNKRRKRHNPEQIVRKLRDADAMLNAGKDLASVLQTLEVSTPDGSGLGFLLTLLLTVEFSGNGVERLSTFQDFKTAKQFKIL
ncbi:hypothetical protein Pan161_15040 [Gimesia algae]|uniref:Uncharacterized protein n=1 Tax=Gimesia algae TaxID=2527971 RepID=A0A517VA33_9PLAN|nr:hypothetical protein Pan161_15040 [Gimesia algae]